MIFPTTGIDKQRVAIIKEVGDILKSVYRKPKAVEEVNATIRTGYYADERILLRDLIFPEKSPVYATEKFRTSGAAKGIFRELFLGELAKGDYPKLKTIFKSAAVNHREADTGAGIDTTHEIWTDQFGTSIYFPYSENFPGISPTDPNNNTPYGNLVTIVSADREADAAPGWEPYYAEPDPNGFACPDNICYRPVTVDDAYAEYHPTHIVGVGAEPARISGHEPTHPVDVVFIGDVKCTHQWDRFISFTGNGGGSELRFCRGSGYLTQDGNGQITSPQNVVSANPTRKQIRKEQWVSVYQIWDANWEPANLNQVFAIYEEDTQGSKSLNLSLKTTVKTSTNTTAEGTVGFSWTFKTQDDIPRQLAWNRQSFYQYNQGGLNNGCGTRNGFTIYDCNSYIRYTMPTQ